MQPDPSPEPLILTLTLDAAAQQWFDALRRTYFPAGRTQVGAHVTMFHALPGARMRAVLRETAAACRATLPLPVGISALRFLGTGVAFALHAPQAEALRAGIAAAFTRDLTRQDAQSWRPHVTIQNKVAAEEARRTQAILQDLDWPEAVTATGIAIWRYKGGPWEHAGAFRFDPNE